MANTLQKLNQEENESKRLAPRNDFVFSRRAGAALFVFFAVLIVCFRLLFTFDPLFDYHEMCHAGGVGRDILHHGHRFALDDYTPDVYKNDYIFEGHAAAAFLAVFGENLFSVILVPFVVSLAVFAIGWFLCARYVSLIGASVFAVLFLLAPPLFVDRSYITIGDYLESTAFGLAVMCCVLWSVRRGGFWRRASAGVFAGAAFWLYRGSLLASAGALLLAVVSAFGRARGRGAGASAGAAFREAVHFCAFFAAGYAPWLLFTTREGRGLAFLAGEKFSGPIAGAGLGAKVKAIFFTTLYGDVLGGNEVLYPVAVAGLVLIAALGARGLARIAAGGDERMEKDSFFALLAVYTVLLFAVMLKVNKPYVPEAYMIHLYPAIFVGAAVLADAAANALGRRLPRTAAAVVVVAAAVLLGHWQPRWTLPVVEKAIAETSGTYYCTWRFGQAFTKTSGGAEGAVRKCSAFEGREALECMAGVATGLDYRGGASPREVCAEFPPAGAPYCAWGIGVVEGASRNEVSGGGAGRLCGDAPPGRHCVEGAVWSHIAKLDYTITDCARPELRFSRGYEFGMFDKFAAGMTVAEYAARHCVDDDFCGWVVGVCTRGAGCETLSGGRRADCKRAAGLLSR